MDLPKGDKAMLFGSQARGDVRVDGILERELIQKIYTTKKMDCELYYSIFLYRTGRYSAC